MTILEHVIEFLESNPSESKGSAFIEMSKTIFVSGPLQGYVIFFKVFAFARIAFIAKISNSNFCLYSKQVSSVENQRHKLSRVTTYPMPKLWIST